MTVTLKQYKSAGWLPLPKLIQNNEPVKIQIQL